jgi:hypothetical protein
MFEFVKVLVLLLQPGKPTTRSVATLRPAGASTSPAPKPPKGQCFSFWSTGVCAKGAACPFASAHHCSKCESTEHGAGQCGAGQAAQ